MTVSGVRFRVAARNDEWAGDDGMSRQSILPDLLRFCQQASDLVRV